MSNRKLINGTSRRFTLVLGIVLGLFTLTFALDARAQGRRIITEDNGKTSIDSGTRITYSDDNHHMEIKASEGLEFSDDDADIKSLPRNGYLIIEEWRGGMSRKFEVVPGADGQPQRSFYLQGRLHLLDHEARAWLADILPNLIRNTAIGAQARVKRIMQQRGPDGVLDEISQIKSDGAKHIYFRELLTNSNPDANTLRRVAKQIAREISSDGEKANLLKESADLYLDNERIAPDFFEAINSISSDGEHARVLSGLLRQQELSKDTLMRIIRSAERISSDGEKANVLVNAVRVYASDGAALSAITDAAKTIGSDGEKQRVLNAVARQGQHP